MFHNHKLDLVQAIQVISYAHASRFSQPSRISYCRIELWGGAIEEEFPLSRKMGWISSIPLCVLSFCSCWPTCSHTCSVWDPNHPKHTHPSLLLRTSIHSGLFRIPLCVLILPEESRSSLKPLGGGKSSHSICTWPGHWQTSFGLRRLLKTQEEVPFWAKRVRGGASWNPTFVGSLDWHKRKVA